MQQNDVKSPGVGERFQTAGALVQANVQHAVVMQRVKNMITASPVRIGGLKVRLELIAPEARVNQIFVAVIAARGQRRVMIDAEFTARVFFGDATIATAAAEPCANFSVLGMCHDVSL